MKNVIRRRIFLVLVFVVSTFSLWLVSHEVYSQVSQCNIPTDGLVSWWPLEGNAEDVQDGNTGVLEGAGGEFVPGKIGLGFKSGGKGSAIVVNDAPNLSVTQFTIDAWIKVDGLNYKNMTIFSRGNRYGWTKTVASGIAVVGMQANKRYNRHS